MASGRLGSAYIGPKRTTQVYANSSGGAASLSVMAQVKSTTANTPISIKIDNGTTAAETETQVDTTSYNEQALKLTYNSGITAVTGVVEYSNYSPTSGNKDVQIRPPSGTTVGTDYNGYLMPMCTDATFTNWKGLENNTYFPLFQSNNRAEWCTVAEAEAAGAFNFVAAQLNRAASGFPTVQKGINMDYWDQGVVADPYCAAVPFIGYNNNNYMSLRYRRQDNGNNGSRNRTSNSILYWISNQGTIDSNQPQKAHFASGGMYGVVHYYDQTMALRYYGMDPSVTRMEQTIQDSLGNTGPNQPLDFWFELANTYSAGYPHIVFLEYDPFQDKIYALMNVGQSTLVRKLYEFQPTKLNELLDNVASVQPYGTSSQGVRIQDDYDRLVTDGVVVDRTDNLPKKLQSATVKTYAPMKRVQNKLWVVGLTDPYGSNTDIIFYKTSDFLTWTEISTSEYYNETVDDDTTVLSDGTDTTKLVSNYTSLPDAGEIEHQTSVNNFERTGLVLSNNDKLYVRNHGDTGVAVSVMGYEE